MTAGLGQLACYTACLQLLATLAQVAALRLHLAENINHSYYSVTAVTAGPRQLACYTACLQLLATLAQVAALRPHLAENIKVRSFIL